MARQCCSILERKSCARSERGFPKNSSFAASSTISPRSMKITRCATLRAKPISCVTTIMVMPSFASPTMTSSTSLIISGSSAEVGSSNSIAIEERKSLARRLAGIASEHFFLRERQIARHRHVRKQLEVLEDHADARAQLRQVGFRIVDRNAVHRDLALLERLEAVHAFDEGRFSAARWAANDHYLAFLHLGRAAGEHLEAAIPFADVPDRDHGIPT